MMGNRRQLEELRDKIEALPIVEKLELAIELFRNGKFGLAKQCAWKAADEIAKLEDA